MSIQNIIDKLDRTHGAPTGKIIYLPPDDKWLILWGEGVPSNTIDKGFVYIDITGATGDLVLYTWDETAGQWDAMTA